MQTKRNSFYEACINTLIGFIVTLIFSPMIYAICGIKTSPLQLGLATAYFTILSVLRSYVIRRFFNGLKPREYQVLGSKYKDKKENFPPLNEAYLDECQPHIYGMLPGGASCINCGEPA